MITALTWVSLAFEHNSRLTAPLSKCNSSLCHFANKCCSLSFANGSSLLEVLSIRETSRLLQWGISSINCNTAIKRLHREILMESGTCRTMNSEDDDDFVFQTTFQCASNNITTIPSFPSGVQKMYNFKSNFLSFAAIWKTIRSHPSLEASSQISRCSSICKWYSLWCLFRRYLQRNSIFSIYEGAFLGSRNLTVLLVFISLLTRKGSFSQRDLNSSQRTIQGS
jgi:hypothetical protein